MARKMTFERVGTQERESGPSFRQAPVPPTADPGVERAALYAAGEFKDMFDELTKISAESEITDAKISTTLEMKDTRKELDTYHRQNPKGYAEKIDKLYQEHIKKGVQGLDSAYAKAAYSELMNRKRIADVENSAKWEATKLIERNMVLKTNDTLLEVNSHITGASHDVYPDKIIQGDQGFYGAVDLFNAIKSSAEASGIQVENVDEKGNPIPDEYTEEFKAYLQKYRYLSNGNLYERLIEQAEEERGGETKLETYRQHILDDNKKTDMLNLEQKNNLLKAIDRRLNSFKTRRMAQARFDAKHPETVMYRNYKGDSGNLTAFRRKKDGTVSVEFVKRLRFMEDIPKAYRHFFKTERSIPGIKTEAEATQDSLLNQQTAKTTFDMIFGSDGEISRSIDYLKNQEDKVYPGEGSGLWSITSGELFPRPKGKNQKWAEGDLAWVVANGYMFIGEDWLNITKGRTVKNRKFTQLDKDSREAYDTKRKDFIKKYPVGKYFLSEADKEDAMEAMTNYYYGIQQSENPGQLDEKALQKAFDKVLPVYEYGDDRIARPFYVSENKLISSEKFSNLVKGFDPYAYEMATGVLPLEKDKKLLSLQNKDLMNVGDGKYAIFINKKTHHYLDSDGAKKNFLDLKENYLLQETYNASFHEDGRNSPYYANLKEEDVISADTAVYVDQKKLESDEKLLLSAIRHDKSKEAIQRPDWKFLSNLKNKYEKETSDKIIKEYHNIYLGYPTHLLKDLAYLEGAQKGAGALAKKIKDQGTIFDTKDIEEIIKQRLKNFEKNVEIKQMFREKIEEGL